ncbi:ER membrane protein complex subunit 1 [Chloropicon primus]|nr:ER membrane protein complex subunit 1 [Chloropicon primus]
MRRRPCCEALLPLVALLILSQIAPRAHAIYAEEAGKHDWHRENVGFVREAVFLPSFLDASTNLTTRAVAVLAEQKMISVLNQRSGAIIWRKELGGAVDSAGVAGSQLVTLSEGKTRVQSFDFRTGALVWDKAAETGTRSLASSDDGKAVAAVTDAELIVYGKSGTREETARLNAKQERVEAAGSTFDVGGVSDALKRSLAAELGLGQKAAISEAYVLGETKYVVAVETVQGKCTAKVINLKTKEVVDTEEYKFGGSAEKVFLTGYQKKEGKSVGFRILLVSADKSLCLLQQSEVVWLREEALASIVHTIVVDFPLSGEKVEAASGKEDAFTIWDEINMQVLAFKSSLMLATPKESLDLKAFQLAKKKTEPAYFDSNGFKKQILALTSVGKLFALHTSDGRVLWTKDLGEGDDYVDMWVYKQDPSHAGMQIGILSSNKAKTESKFLVVDGWSGALLSNKSIKCAADSVMKLQPAGSSSLQAALLADYEASKGHVVVADDSDLGLLDLRSTFLFNVDEANGVVSGYNLSPKLSGGDATLPLTNLWSLKLKEGQKIVGTASPNFFQKVYSRTRVLGDRSALYKYINPNTLFVSAESVGDKGEPKLTIYLVDTVTGKMLYSITHKNAWGPVHVVFHENWIVYKYWNIQGNRDEMSVLELYEDEPLKNSNSISSHLFNLITKTNQSNFVSSYAPSAIRVLGQSYVLSLPVKTMTVTTSSLGITANQVLVGTLSDQIYAIDKKLLDPRRPVKPTNADKEEGLIPYNEFLPIAPQKFITYTHQVAGLRDIQCFPTRRESSVLVFAYGVDMFYTRLMPSKSFDMLEDDFSYSLLVTTILGLLVATFVVRSRVQKDNLKRNWM